jgi:hypothetical protein
MAPGNWGYFYFPAIAQNFNAASLDYGANQKTRKIDSRCK